MKKILGLFFLLMSSVIGAGIITGQEILSFFGGFNYKTFISIILAGVIFFFILNKILNFDTNENFQKLKQTKVYKIFVVVANIVVAGAMVAGAESFSIRSGFSLFIGLAILILACIFSAKFVKAFKKMAKILSFLLIAGFIYVCVTNLGLETQIVTKSQNFYKGFFFSSFNCFLLLPLGEDISVLINKKQKLILSAMVSVTLCVFLTIGSICASRFGGAMPLVQAAKESSFFFFYVPLAFIAIFTTLFSCTYALKKICKTNNILFLLFIVCIFIISLFGFEKIVSIFYTISGVIASLLFIFT